MGANLPSWKPIYFDRTYRQKRWLMVSAPTRLTVLTSLSDNGVLSFDRSDLLEQPLLVSIETKQHSHDTHPARRREILRRPSMPTQREEAP